MSKSESVSKLIEELDDHTSPPSVIADKLLSEIRGTDQFDDLIMPLLVDMVVNKRRNETRRREERVDRLIKEGVDPSAARKTFVNEAFYTPEFGMVFWRFATAEQHWARAAHQRARGDACYVDARRHESAAMDIETAGVTCLDDLNEAD